MIDPLNKNTIQNRLIQECIDLHQTREGALLPLLHSIQDKLGYIPPESVPHIAKALQLSTAEVHGVVSYYHFFRTRAPGRHVVQICRAEACQACGSESLLALAEKALGCSLHQTTADGRVTLEPVYCLGLCASSPAIQVDERLHARVDEAKLHALLERLEAA